VSLPEALSASLDRPVFVDNDGNLALFGEHAAGSARNADTAVMFTIGTGIGGAVMSHGALFRGKYAAGQLGHLAMAPDGELCLCGRRGCIETLSSGTALRRHIAEAGSPASTTVDDLFARAAENDATAKAVLAAWAKPMRAAIDTIVAAFDPDVVVLGGGLGAAMHQALADFPAEAPWYQCTVVPAALGDRAGVIGAGLSALAQVRAER
jgi:glucokinase